MQSYFAQGRLRHLRRLSRRPLVQLRRADAAASSPTGGWSKLDSAIPIFHSFFEIKIARFRSDVRPRAKASFHGMFEDNDPTKRLLLIANYNNDIGEYWEFSDQGYVPVDLSNEAYKFGVNYVCTDALTQLQERGVSHRGI